MDKKKDVQLTAGEKNMELRFNLMKKVMPIKDKQMKEMILNLFTYILSM